MNASVVGISSSSSNPKQSPGAPPTPPPAANKRNSGIFSFLKWFRSSSRESVSSLNSRTSSAASGSSESLSSTGTAGSFSYVPPAAYAANVQRDRRIQPGPETDTYRARLKQRDRVREKDKNTTLRKKYNLFFGRDKDKDKSDYKSLPLMTKHRMVEEVEAERGHRRTNSDSSRNRNPGGYLHVKGKRKAPAPPRKEVENSSLRRKKRLAPQPPLIDQKTIDAVFKAEPQTSLNPATLAIEAIEYVDVDVLHVGTPPDLVQNDSLRLDLGMLQPTKNLPNLSASPKLAPKLTEFPVSPKPWYKRGANMKRESRYEPVMQPVDNNNDKLKSNMMFLTNISELDREANEIMRKSRPGVGELKEMPEFMKAKTSTSKEIGSDASAGVHSKRKSAKDLIAKFNAITSVTKVTVNTALFGAGNKRDYFGHKESKPVGQKGDNRPTPLMKSETSACILTPVKPNTPKLDRRSWRCPKCNVGNDYWRIICSACSTIKPYFDDLGRLAESTLAANEGSASSSSTSSSSHSGNNKEGLPSQELAFKVKEQEVVLNTVKPQMDLPQLARSRTQIHFYNNPQTQRNTSQQHNQETRLEEKEKLKKMLIEMKNSLPKRKSHGHLMQKRKSTIDETPENQINDAANKSKGSLTENMKAKQIAPIDPNINQILDEKLTNIERQSEQKQKAIRSSPPKANSSGVETPASNASSRNRSNEQVYQLFRPKDFEDIYAEKVSNTQSNLHVYSNYEDKDVIFNVPQHLKQDLPSGLAKDTLEISKLLRKLETAISNGYLQDASGYARELAQLKVNCSVVRQRCQENEKKQNKDEGNSFTVQMYVEDRLSHRGPFPIQVQPTQTVRELKEQIQKMFEIPIEVQRWILGKELAINENLTLREHNVTEKDASIFLYLVAPSGGDNLTANKVEQDISIVGSKSIKSEVLGTVSSNASTSGVVLTKASPLSRSENSAFALVQPQGGFSSGQSSSPPKIVGGQLKVHVMIKPKCDSETHIGNGLPRDEEVPQRTDLVTAVKTSIVVQQAPSKMPSKAQPEDVTLYDTRVTQWKAKPKSTEATKNWVCHMCTLVNISTANVCSICATVRQKPNEEEATGGKVKLVQKTETVNEIPENEQNHLHYFELMNLDNSDLVPNADAFECLICFADVEPQKGVTLRECLHQFCRGCLAQLIEYYEDAEIKCPYRDEDYSCDIALQDREIKALVSKAVYEQYLARSVAQAENTMDKSFHCKTPDCTGWCIYEDNVNEFRCPLCKKTNCLTCQAIHSGLNCWQYQERMHETDEDAKETRAWFNELLAKGEAMMCPACQVILMKKWGCDWVRCSMCKTEICWVTRGLRWGPGGKGDVSGGCKCGVHGIKCHAKCNYCH